MLVLGLSYCTKQLSLVGSVTTRSAPSCSSNCQHSTQDPFAWMDMTFGDMALNKIYKTMAGNGMFIYIYSHLFWVEVVCQSLFCKQISIILNPIAMATFFRRDFWRFIYPFPYQLDTAKLGELDT